MTAECQQVHTLRVSAAYSLRLFASTEPTVARIAATAWRSRTRNVARRGLEQCSGMLDLARSFPVGKEKSDTAAPPDLVADTSAQEGRQGRALLEIGRYRIRRYWQPSRASHGHVQDNRMFRVGLAACILSLVASSGHI